MDYSHYKVIVDLEEQFGIWPADWINPPGWTDEDFEGTQEECLAYITEEAPESTTIDLTKLIQEREQQLGL